MPAEFEIEKFFNSEELQKKYVDRVNSLRKKLRELYPEEFDIELHGEMVKQMVRSEIQCFDYERSVAGDTETRVILQLLGNERVHLRALWEQLQTSLRSIRGDRSTVKVEVPKDFTEFLLKHMEKSIDIVEEAKDESKSGDSGETKDKPNT